MQIVEVPKEVVKEVEVPVYKKVLTPVPIEIPIPVKASSAVTSFVDLSSHAAQVCNFGLCPMADDDDYYRLGWSAGA